MSSTQTSVTHLRANLMALGVGGAALAGVIAADWYLWGRARDASAYEISLLPFVIVLLISVVAHEWLHAVGFWLFGGVPWKDIRISVNWRALTPYATTPVLLPARAYWWTAALPAIVQGVIPAVAGLSFGVWQLSGYGAMMLAAASGDMIVLWLLRSVGPNIVVRDHPTRIGFELAPPA
jgi:putative zincin peptidase